MIGRSDGQPLDSPWPQMTGAQPGEDSAVVHGQVLVWPDDAREALRRDREALPGKIAELGAQTNCIPEGEAPQRFASYPETPPARVSSDPNHPDFHPSARRIAVMVDGRPMGNVHWYDAPAGVFRITDDGRDGQLHSGQVTVYWRWEESRQERRARERWDSKHGAR